MVYDMSRSCWRAVNYLLFYLLLFIRFSFFFFSVCIGIFLISYDVVTVLVSVNGDALRLHEISLYPAYDTMQNLF